MSYQTRVEYIVANSQREFDLSVPYLDRNHIKVVVNGAQEPIEWVHDSRVRLNFPKVDGSVVRITRVTPIADALVTFQNGANLPQEDLNKAILQLLYKAQETDDLYYGSLDAARVRLGEKLGVITTPDAIVDELLRVSELGDDLLNRFRDALANIDLSSAKIIQQALDLTQHAFRLDNLTGIVDALANLEGGTGLATIIQNEADQRLIGDTALATTLSLIGARNGSNTGFIFDTNKVQVSPTETLAQRFNAIYAANQNALALIQTEQTARTSADEAFVQSLNTYGARLGQNEAAVASEIAARSTAVSAEASARQALSAAIPGQISAAVLTETNARVAADSAEATARQSLATQVGQNSTAIQNEATVRANADTAFSQQFAILGAFRNGQTAFVLDLNRVEVGAGYSLGTRLSGIDTAVGNVSASVVAEQTARAGQFDALSQTLSTVQNTVGGNTASITNLTQVTNGLNARWTLALNSNGHLVGITANNNGSYGTLAFVADEMSFVTPTGGTPIKIMSVVANKVRFNSNVEIYGDLLVTGTINNGKLTDNTVSGIQAGYNATPISLQNSTPTRVHGVWIDVEKASSPIDIDFSCWGTFVHDAGGSFIATVQLVRSRGESGGTVISSFNVNGSGMSNDVWQGPIPVKFLDRPNETGGWHYYVQIFFNVGNMTTQTISARYGKVVEMKNNTSSLGGGTGSGAGVGSGGGTGGGGGGTNPPIGPGGGGGGGTEMPTVE